MKRISWTSFLTDIDAPAGEAMELGAFFKSIVDQDTCPIVICDLDHTIVYMNPTAVSRYAKWGGEALIGKSVLDCHAPFSVEMIRRVIDWFGEDASHNIRFTHHRKKQNSDVYMVALRDDDARLIGYYEKHEIRTPEEKEVCHAE